MGTNEKILLGAVILAVGVGGFIYVERKGGINKIFGKPDDKPTNIKPANINAALTHSAYTTPTSIRTKKIQSLLAESGYLQASDVDGRWGVKTDTAFKKATSEKKLVNITDEKSYQSWLSNFSGGGGNNISPSEGIHEIAKYIRKEINDENTRYGIIRDKLSPLNSAQIKAVDNAYREYSSKGLFHDFKNKDKGGKVSWETYNVTAIREILNDAGLK